MQHRTIVKWFHWLSFGLILYFFIVEPKHDRIDPGGALSTHAGMGVVLALVVGAWFALYLRRGLVGRAGPKLSDNSKKFYAINHRLLTFGAPLMVGTGIFAGLAAPFLIDAFGILPINTGSGSKSLHNLATEVHDIVFNLLVLVIILHAIFHIWRHVRLKDNALRMMTPKALHKYL